MQDLNDLFFFVQVVEKGGFAAAGRALAVPKSRLSRRIALLEERLGARLLQRSTRKLALTEVGQVYLRHCQAMIAEAQAAQEAVDRMQTEPQGWVRVSCPVALAQSLLADILPFYMQAHPLVRVHLEVTNRRVDVIEEGFDLAIRVRTTPLEDSSLVVRSFVQSRVALLASPALLQRQGMPQRPEQLIGMDSLGMTAPEGRHGWHFTGPGGTAQQIAYAPRLVSDDMLVLKQAALDGLGLVALPEYLCREELKSGRLHLLLADWQLPSGNMHMVFPSRRGLVPAVRSFIDFLTLHIPALAEQRGVGGIS